MISRYISLQVIQTTRWYAHKYPKGSTESLIPAEPYQDLEYCYGEKSISKVHALELKCTGRWLFSDIWSVVAYVVTLENEESMKKMAASVLADDKQQHQKIREQGEKALASYKTWLAKTQSCCIVSEVLGRKITFAQYHSEWVYESCDIFFEFHKPLTDDVRLIELHLAWMMYTRGQS
jgi:hypothetical protein